MSYLGVILPVCFLALLLFLYFLYITTPKKKTTGTTRNQSFSRAQVAQKWVEISEMMKAGGPANFKTSIMEADKLVDLVLKSKVPGETMGERLKKSRSLFSSDVYNGLWTAHKIRNKVAHESEFEGLSSDARLAVRNFEKALKELRVIK